MTRSSQKVISLCEIIQVSANLDDPNTSGHKGHLCQNAVLWPQLSIQHHHSAAASEETGSAGPEH